MQHFIFYMNISYIKCMIQSKLDFLKSDKFISILEMWPLSIASIFSVILWLVMILYKYIWICDEGNMEIFESEATRLTETMLRSILLPKIYKTHIAWHHRSIIALLYVKCLWFKNIGLWIHILLDSP